MWSVTARPRVGGRRAVGRWGCDGVVLVSIEVVRERYVFVLTCDGMFCEFFGELFSGRASLGGFLSIIFFFTRATRRWKAMRPSGRELGRPRAGGAELNRGASIVIGNLLGSGRALRARSAIVSGMSRWACRALHSFVCRDLVVSRWEYQSPPCLFKKMLVHP